MKKLLILVSALFFIFLAACDLAGPGRSFSSESRTGTTEADIDYVFDINAVPAITILISTNEWNTLLTNYDTRSDNEEMVHADLTFDKNGEIVTLYDIGFRIRGNTSRSRPEVCFDPDVWTNLPGGLHGEGANFYTSTHFRIGFDHFVSGQKLYGLKNLNLKWFKDDPLYMREIYGYDLFRRFGVWCTPQNTYTRVYVQFKETGENIYFGPYNMIEAVDKVFLKTHFTNNSDGFLWKCLYKTYGASMNYPVPEDAFGVEQASLTNVWTPTYDLKSRKTELDTARAQFQAFLQDLNSLTPGSASLYNWLESHLAVDLFLRTLAVGTMIGHWDSYWNLGQNYYFYFDNTGKAYFIPYDHDNILGTGTFTFLNPATYDVTDMPGAWGEDRPLVDQVLSIPAYRQVFYNYLAELIAEDSPYFGYQASTNRIMAWRALISPYMTGIEVAAENKNNFNTISDAPGWWGQYPDFRIFSGDESGNATNGTECNYFKSRAQFTAMQLGLPHITWSPYSHNYSQVYITGNWPGLDWTNSLRMNLVSDYTWQITMTNAGPTTWFKFKTHQFSWAYDEWGDPNHDGIGDLHDGQSPWTTNTGLVIFTFNEQTLQMTPYY